MPHASESWNWSGSLRTDRGGRRLSWWRVSLKITFAPGQLQIKEAADNCFGLAEDCFRFPEPIAV